MGVMPPKSNATLCSHQEILVGGQRAPSTPDAQGITTSQATHRTATLQAYATTAGAT